MKIINTEWGLNSYLELKNTHVFSTAEYRLKLKPDVMLLLNFPHHEKFNQNKFWSPAKDLEKQAIKNGFKMKWHNIGHGRTPLRLPIVITGKKSFLCEAYVKENESVEKRKLAKFKTYAQLIQQGKYRICGQWGNA